MKQEDLKQATFEKVLEVAISERTNQIIIDKFKDEEYVARYIYATIEAQLKRHDLKQFLLEPLDSLVNEELGQKDLKTPLKKLAKEALKKHCYIFTRIIGLKKL